MPKFEPGKSGNPGGRPKVVAEVQKHAREYSKEAMETLVEIMRDKKAPQAARGVASNSILDRAYGKPLQSNVVANLGAGKRPEQMSDDELLAVINAPQEHDSGDA